MAFPRRVTNKMTPAECLGHLVAFVETEPDDDALCAAALEIVEPTIDWHWRTVTEEFEALLAERSDVRKIVSCCDFDESVPEAIRDWLYAYGQPDEDIGHRPA